MGVAMICAYYVYKLTSLLWLELNGHVHSLYGLCLCCTAYLTMSTFFESRLMTVWKSAEWATTLQCDEI